MDAHSSMSSLLSPKQVCIHFFLLFAASVVFFKINERKLNVQVEHLLCNLSFQLELGMLVKEGDEIFANCCNWILQFSWTYLLVFLYVLLMFTQDHHPIDSSSGNKSWSIHTKAPPIALDLFSKRRNNREQKIWWKIYKKKSSRFLISHCWLLLKP